jgi:hypothetical protein
MKRDFVLVVGGGVYLRPVVPRVHLHRAEQQQRRQAFKRDGDGVTRRENVLNRALVFRNVVGQDRKGLLAERVARGLERDARNRRRADPGRELGDDARGGRRRRDADMKGLRFAEFAASERRVDDDARGLQETRRVEPV